MKPHTIATLANEIRTKIARLNGESATFTVETPEGSADVNYTAEIGDDKGDRYTAPSWWKESESIEIEGVYDEEGDFDEEATEALEQYLNE